jgi:hypothetical protein
MAVGGVLASGFVSIGSWPQPLRSLVRQIVVVEQQETLPMRRRRRLLLAVGALALIGVAGFAFFLWLTSPTPAPGVTWENSRRLRAGMSVRDVEALLGKPSPEVTEIVGGGTGRWWRGEEVDIELVFDADRVLFGVASSQWKYGRPRIEYIRPAESFLDCIRRWLHL